MSEQETIRYIIRNTLSRYETTQIPVRELIDEAEQRILKVIGGDYIHKDKLLRILEIENVGVSFTKACMIHDAQQQKAVGK